MQICGIKYVELYSRRNKRNTQYGEKTVTMLMLIKKMYIKHELVFVGTHIVFAQINLKETFFNFKQRRG